MYGGSVKTGSILWTGLGDGLVHIESDALIARTHGLTGGDISVQHDPMRCSTLFFATKESTYARETVKHLCKRRYQVNIRDTHTPPPYVNKKNYRGLEILGFLCVF